MILSLLYLLLVIGDLSVTYIETPDLTYEANPLVAIWGLGWKSLIMSNIINYIFFLIATYYTFVWYKRAVIKCKGVKEFLSILFFDNPNKFICILFKLPVNRASWINWFAPIGYAVIFSFMIGRLLAIIDWIGILSGNLVYRKIYFSVHSVVPSRVGMVLLGIILFMCFYCHWVLKEYKLNNY